MPLKLPLCTYPPIIIIILFIILFHFFPGGGGVDDAANMCIIIGQYSPPFFIILFQLKTFPLFELHAWAAIKLSGKTWSSTGSTDLKLG